MSQIPALIVSLAAGLLVSKGGTRGQAQQAVLGQLGAYPKAMWVAAALLMVFAVLPGLPFLPFMMLAATLGFLAYIIPQRRAEEVAREAAAEAEKERMRAAETRESVKESLKTPEIEICFGLQVGHVINTSRVGLPNRVAKLRRKFAMEYGFVVPDIKLTENVLLPPKLYQIRIHGTVVATWELQPGNFLVLVESGEPPKVPGDLCREPAFGKKALWVQEAMVPEVRRQKFQAVECAIVVLTHLSEVIRNNLPQFLSYRDMRILLDRLEPEYKRLLDEICPAHISHAGLQAVLKLLLAERVSIRNLQLILEAVAEIAPHSRRAEQIVEHVRVRMSQHLCGDLSQGGPLHVLQLGAKWEVSLHGALVRDGNGEATRLDIDPRVLDELNHALSASIQLCIAKLAQRGERLVFAIVTAPETRSYVRTIVERMFPQVPVLSSSEISRTVEISTLGSIGDVI